jgi:hypothetical protein
MSLTRHRLFFVSMMPSNIPQVCSAVLLLLKTKGAKLVKINLFGYQ